MTPTGASSAAAPWEPSAWLRQAVNRRRSQLHDREIDKAVEDVVVGALGRKTFPGTRAERECCRCTAYVPPTLDLWRGAIQAIEKDGTVVLLTLVLCPRCLDAEGIR